MQQLLWKTVSARWPKPRSRSARHDYCMQHVRFSTGYASVKFEKSIEFIGIVESEGEPSHHNKGNRFLARRTMFESANRLRRNINRSRWI
jgi:hypothetical protein